METKRIVMTLTVVATLHVGDAIAQETQAAEASLSEGLAALAPEPWAAQDPADSLYRAARRELNRGDYARAASLFQRVRSQHRNSQYAPDAFYWEAFARSRMDDTDEMRAALELLRTQEREYPRATTRDDARALAMKISGELARLGDANAAQEVVEQARRDEQACPEEEDDVRAMALNALLNMDAQRAVPILRQVLDRRDACSAELRRRAVWIISQQQSPETTSILLRVARDDPDRETREAAVFWLSQVESEAAVEALEEILMSAEESSIQDRAIFALSQHESTRSGEILRSYAMRRDVSTELREKAIFWLGHMDAQGNDEFLRDLYGTLDSRKLKEKVIFAMSQLSSANAAQWLLDVALDENESVELRKSALFWAGQSDQLSLSRMRDIYQNARERELREQVIFVLSQRDEVEAIDILMDVARTENDQELKKKAIFWLGQSDDPRVPEFLLEILNKPPR